VNTLRFVAAALGLPALTWFIGGGLLRRMGALDAEEWFVASPGIGIALLAGSQFVLFVSGAHAAFFGVLALGAMVALSSWLWRTRAREGPHVVTLSELSPAFAALASAPYVHLLLIQALLPIYYGAGWSFDWWMHFDEALVFLGDKPVTTVWAGHYSLLSRTPLFNLYGAFAMSLFGHEFWIFQVASTFMNSCVCGAMYLVVRDRFDRRAGAFALALFPLNVWMLHGQWFTWPKMLAAYFGILGLHFYAKSSTLRSADSARSSRHLRFSALFLGLGILAHPVVAVYAFALLVHARWLGWRDAARRISLSEAARAAGVPVALLFVWGIWGVSTFWSSGFSASNPLPEVSSSDPLAFFYNVVASVIPLELVSALSSRSALDPKHFYRGLVDLYFSLFTGCLTISLSLFLVSRVRKLGVRAVRQNATAWLEPANSSVVAFLLIGTSGAMALHTAPHIHGTAHDVWFPSVIVLTAMAWAVLAGAPERLRKIVCAGMVLENGVVLWSHILHLHHRAASPPEDNLILKLTNGLVFLNDYSAAPMWLVVAAALAVEAALMRFVFTRSRQWSCRP